MKFRLYQCPEHPQFYTITLGDEHGGLRVLGGQCCPSQYAKELNAWPADKRVLNNILMESTRVLHILSIEEKASIR